MMSPSSSRDTSWWMTASTGAPAATMRTIRRGRSSPATRSSIENTALTSSRSPSAAMKSAMPARYPTSFPLSSRLMTEPVLGIDIGGSGIKANLVDLALGDPVGERYKVDTPQPSIPEAVAEVVVDVVKHFDSAGPIGCTFPAVVRRGVTLSAANVDEAWIGTDAAALFSRATGLSVVVVNDADAAGLAEICLLYTS